MIKAVLLQFANQSRDAHNELLRLRTSYHSGTPPLPVLVDCLHRIIRLFKNVYLLLDALDESPQPRCRDELLDTLEEIRQWAEPGLHLLVTSRDLPDIREGLQAMNTEMVEMKNSSIDDDISSYITGMLHKNRKFRAWRPHTGQIHQALSKRAKGVFRYVECQLKSLERCPSSEHHLERLLSSLPESLDETYERILLGIEPLLREDARRILTLLCYAVRPLAVTELIDGLAVELTEPARFNPRHRLQDVNDLHKICPGLIEFSPATGLDYPDRIFGSDECYMTAQIAHFSVQEYLESDRLRQHIDYFSLQIATGHRDLAHMYLTYLLETTLCNSALSVDIIRQYPLTSLAAQSWFFHVRLASTEAKALDSILLKLFTNWTFLANWARMISDRAVSNTLQDMRYIWIDDVTLNYLERQQRVVGNPIYYACLLGFDHIFELIIEIHAHQCELTSSDHSTLPKTLEKMINDGGGDFGTPLRAASQIGQIKLVKRLLELGANVNARCETNGGALHTASEQGHEEVVSLLLENGADVNASGKWYATALQEASSHGHLEAVKLLVNKGADVNVQGKTSNSALACASSSGNIQIVELLLDKGAHIDGQGGTDCPALLAAISAQNLDIVSLLLERGANVDLCFASVETPLEAAVWTRDILYVKLLLRNGANVNAREGRNDTALARALESNQPDMALLLVHHGAQFDRRDHNLGVWEERREQAIWATFFDFVDNLSWYQEANPYFEGKKSFPRRIVLPLSSDSGDEYGLTH